MGRLFGTDGVRGRANADLTPELAMAVAKAAAHVLAERDRSHPPLAVVGRDPRASGEMLEAATPQRLDGLRVVVDCANGASSEVAPEAYQQAGAEVVAIHAAPDGLNINEHCGSTHLESLRAAVLEHGADLGIAHDGDADR